jgi:membrane protein
VRAFLKPLPEAAARGGRDFLGILKEAAEDWYWDKTFEMGAALAFYAVFTIAPMLVLAIAVAGLFLGRSAAHAEAFQHLRGTLGSTVAGALQGLLEQGSADGAGGSPTWMSLGVLVVGALGFFGQLQQSLNSIWKVRSKAGRGFWGMIRDRIWSFLMILVAGALVLAFLLLPALPVVDRLSSGLLWRVIDWVVGLAFFTLLFALVYKLLPDVRLDWEHVWAGAGLTALLFLLGNGLIALYLRELRVASAYGAAGSVVVLLLWVFYSAQLFLFGAEFTQVLVRRTGRPRELKPNAERLCSAGPRPGGASETERE